MLHQMKLKEEPFRKIKEGKKDIELRLYDEKRQKIKVGDEICFTNISTGEKVYAKVKTLHLFDSFEKLYATLDKVRIGYTEDEVADFRDMEKYYPKEEQEKYKVVGIEVCVL